MQVIFRHRQATAPEALSFLIAVAYASRWVGDSIADRLAAQSVVCAMACAGILYLAIAVVVIRRWPAIAGISRDHVDEAVDSLRGLLALVTSN